MTPFIKKIVKNHVRVLLYYGETDMACNFMMGQQFADQLGLRRTLKKTPWKFDRQMASMGSASLLSAEPDIWRHNGEHHRCITLFNNSYSIIHFKLIYDKGVIYFLMINTLWLSNKEYARMKGG
ncbi:hypothetical protein CRE_19995 [Caenorhabditis remanei]|uniref:Carboxypeptidase n=1 Tax=Caenorhabditis remanei TaxID=31234 RepID=E3NCE8_CAERE|nr:hypothetical protein CRE_19995 [Caenorhabditis remanei]